MHWQRARKPEQIEKRKNDILNAAAELFLEKGYDAVSFNAIARHAGQAKANLYRYFDSKENIFLELFYTDLVTWGDDLKTALSEKEWTIEELSEVITESVLNHKRLADLTSILTTVLEKNISYEVALDFKLRMYEFSGEILKELKKLFPQLTEEQLSRFFTMVHVLIAGIWPMAHPSATIQKVYEHPDLKNFCVSFERDFPKTMTTFLRGLIAESHKKEC